MDVLAVDDDEISLALMVNALTPAHRVYTARNGREALRIAEEGKCRLVISDWDMPDMSGLDLCRALRASDICGYFYFVLLTARNASGEKVVGLSAGADDFMAKPFDPAELLVRVRAGERILSLETRDVAIFAMARLAESRDPDTGAHLERVQSYSRLLAQHLAARPEFHDVVDTEFIRLIYLTSPLHDIGKVGVPDAVLLKNGPLDEREFEIMKAHTLIGAATLQDTVDRFPGVRFLQMARDIVATHHERYDGSGYPYGLRGEDIPLCGRIVAVADVYDALTSKRVYKEMYPHAIARSMIVESAGSHFDPDIVEAFLRCEDEFVAVAKRYAEDHSNRPRPETPWQVLTAAGGPAAPTQPAVDNP